MDGVTHECRVPPHPVHPRGALLHSIPAPSLPERDGSVPKGAGLGRGGGAILQASLWAFCRGAGHVGRGLQDKGTPCALFLPVQVTTCTLTPVCWAPGAPLPGWRASTCLLLPTPACGSGTTWTSRSTSVSTAGAGRGGCRWGGCQEPMMGLGQGLQTPSPPTLPWTLRFSSGGAVGMPILAGYRHPRGGWHSREGPVALEGLRGCQGACPPPRCSLRGAAGEAAQCGGAAHGVERGGAPEPGLAGRRGACAEPQRVPGEWGGPGVQGALRGCGVPSPDITPPHIPSPATDHL